MTADHADRDALAALLHGVICGCSDPAYAIVNLGHDYADYADAILAAGWVSPERRVGDPR